MKTNRVWLLLGVSGSVAVSALAVADPQPHVGVHPRVPELRVSRPGPQQATPARTPRVPPAALPRQQIESYTSMLKSTVARGDGPLGDSLQWTSFHIDPTQVLVPLKASTGAIVGRAGMELEQTTIAVDPVARTGWAGFDAGVLAGFTLIFPTTKGVAYLVDCSVNADDRPFDVHGLAHDTIVQRSGHLVIAFVAESTRADSRLSIHRNDFFWYGCDVKAVGK